MQLLDHSELTDLQREQFELSFRAQLEPLYGNQTVALDKIASGEDRSGIVLVDDSSGILGTLVIKNSLTSENYPKQYDITGIEIKTLTLFNPAITSGRGLASILATRAIEHAAAVDPLANLFVTVASSKPESRAFFKKHEFTIEHEVLDAYTTGNKEAVMVRRVV